MAKSIKQTKNTQWEYSHIWQYISSQSLTTNYGFRHTIKAYYYTSGLEISTN